MLYFLLPNIVSGLEKIFSIILKWDIKIFLPIFVWEVLLWLWYFFFVCFENQAQGPFLSTLKFIL